MRSLALLTVSMIAVCSIAVPAEGASCPNCPSGAQCACIDCNPCNSGYFQVFCVCWPVPGVVTCNTQNGDCALGVCARCTSTNHQTGQVCKTYGKCGPMVCGPDGCTGDGSAMEMDGCPDCVSTAMPQERPGPVEVVLEALPDFPVEVSRLQLPPTRGELKPGNMEFRNLGGAGLVTLVIELTYEDAEGHEATFAVVSDSWLKDGPFLAAGARVEVPIATVVQGEAVTRVTARPLYAEFDNGLRTGPGLDSVRGCLAAERETALQAYQDALRLYEEQGGDALEAALREDPQLELLVPVLEEKGLDGVLEVLSRPRRLLP